MINEPLMGHAASAHIQQAFFKRILEHVAVKREQSVAVRERSVFPKADNYYAEQP